MKPTVVFYGETVPQPTVDLVEHVAANADAFLVLGTQLLLAFLIKSCDTITSSLVHGLGSTLTTWSAFRIIRKKKEQNPDFPVYIVNIGATRADHLATIKIEANCSHVLETIDRHFGL